MDGQRIEDCGLKMSESVIRLDAKRNSIAVSGGVRRDSEDASYAPSEDCSLDRQPAPALSPGTSERGPLLLVPCLVGIFDRLNRLDVFGNILRRQAVFPTTCKDKVLVPAIGFEAVVDIVWGGEIGKDLPPATFVVDDRDHRVLVAATDAFGLI